MDVHIQKIEPGIEMPQYAKPDDAGFDLRAAENTVIKSGARKSVRTGMAVAIPKNFVGLIWDRSGIATTNGVHCLAGVVDAGYRGEIKACLVNLGETDFEIKKNDRICQLLVQPVVQARLIPVDRLDETVRGKTGFGSSGRQ